MFETNLQGKLKHILGSTTFFLSYLAPLFTELKIFQTKFVEKIKTHILCSITLFSEGRAVNEII
jgi:hypothetical protein